MERHDVEGVRPLNNTVTKCGQLALMKRDKRM
jgi:hypothetical protein